MIITQGLLDGKLVLQGFGGGNTYNETMSGGVYGAGAASVVGAYSPQSTAAGVWSGGTGTNIVTFNPSIIPAGVWAGGSSVTAATYNLLGGIDGPLAAGGLTSIYDETMNGGLLAAGAALYGGSQSFVPQPDGVLAAGSATITSVWNYEGSGGLRGLGGDVDQAMYNVMVSTDGPVLSGSGVSNTYTIAIVPAGVDTNGNSPISTSLSPLSSGGSASSGSALVSVRTAYRIAYKFKIGDVVYVKSSYTGSYLRQGVRAIFSDGGLNYYYLGLGWFSEKECLTYRDYLNVLCQNVTAASNNASQRLKLLRNTCASRG